VDNINSIWNGALSNQSPFFGAATAEVISAAVNNGGWERDDADAPTSSISWLFRGGGSSNGFVAGMFMFASGTGGANYLGTHRTILSGY
jgi:hypothetical protein